MAEVMLFHHAHGGAPATEGAGITHCLVKSRMSTMTRLLGKQSLFTSSGFSSGPLLIVCPKGVVF